MIAYPIMGDITGDYHKEIGGVDGKNNFHLWTWDGRKLPGTQSIGGFNSVMATDIGNIHGQPTLADMDGDGKAEIILFDGRRRLIRAWTKGATELTQRQGFPIFLRDILVWPSPGVTVVDLGGDGEMDLFCGAFWIRLAKNGAVQITNMLPTYVQTTTDATIADVDNDGRAEAIFGLCDGRLFIYQTGKTLRSEWLHWQTRGGNFQHTACWQSPKPLKSPLTAD